MREERERWNRRYHEEPALAALEPSAFIVDHASLLPREGRALDVACGAGRNALFLAERGLETTGIDISSAGLELAGAMSRKRGLSVELIEADLTRHSLSEAHYAVIACLHYLERSLFPALERALAEDGLLFYETFTRAQLAFPESHPRREEFLLGPNELLRAFPGSQVLFYEEGAERLADGRRAVLARLIARRMKQEPKS